MRIVLALLSAAFLAVSAALAAPTVFGGPAPSALAFGLAFGTAILAGIAAALFPRKSGAPEPGQSAPRSGLGAGGLRTIPAEGGTGLGGAENGVTGL